MLKQIKSHENILIYYVGYVATKESKYVKNYSVNSLYLIFNIVSGYFEEINRYKYLTLVPTNESNDKIKNMENCGLQLEIKLS